MEVIFMSLSKRVLGIALILVFAFTGSAFSVGYERHDTPVSASSSRKGMQAVTYEAETESFLRKFPALLDEVAFLVRDLLSQFGLTNSRKP